LIFFGFLRGGSTFVDVIDRFWIVIGKFSLLPSLPNENNKEF
jgi:hypothetical protein